MFKRLLVILIVIFSFATYFPYANTKDNVLTDSGIIDIYLDGIREKHKELVEAMGIVGNEISCYLFDLNNDDIPEMIFYVRGTNHINFFLYTIEDGKAKELDVLGFAHYQADSDFKFAYDGKKIYLAAKIANNVSYGSGDEYAEWEISIEKIMVEQEYIQVTYGEETYIELSTDSKLSSNFKETSKISYDCGQGAQRTDDENSFVYHKEMNNEEFIRLLEQNGKITEKEFEKKQTITKEEYEKEKNKIFHNPNSKYIDFVRDEIEVFQLTIENKPYKVELLEHENLTNGKFEEYLKNKLNDWYELYNRPRAFSGACKWE